MTVELIRLIAPCSFIARNALIEQAQTLVQSRRALLNIVHHALNPRIPARFGAHHARSPLDANCPGHPGPECPGLHIGPNVA